MPESQNQRKYANSSLTATKSEEVCIQLLDCLKKERLFLNPKISLMQLSQKVKSNPHIVSQIINQVFKQNFFELINSLRVEEAKIQLKNKEKSNLTIEGIGKECGFGSPSSFYRAFKKHTGTTPIQYLQNE